MSLQQNDTLMIITIACVLIIVVTVIFVFLNNKSASKETSSSSSSTELVYSPSPSPLSPSPGIQLIKRLRTDKPASTIFGFSTGEINLDMKFDSNDNMYLLTLGLSQSGLSFLKINFYQKQNTGLFLNVPTKTINIPIPPTLTSFLMFDSNDNLFFINGSQILYYSNQLFTTNGAGISPQPHIITINVLERCICFDSSDNLIVFSSVTSQQTAANPSLRFYQKQPSGTPYLNTHTFEITNITNEQSFVSVHIDKNDNVFLLSNSKLYKFNAQSNGNKYINNQIILNGLSYTDMCIDKDDDIIYIFSNNVLYTYQLQNGTYSIISQFNLPSVPNTMFDTIKKFEKDKSGNLIFVIGINKDLLSYNLYYYEKSSTSYKFILQNIYTNGILNGGRDSLLFRFDSKNNLAVNTYSSNVSGTPNIKYYIAS